MHIWSKIKKILGVLVSFQRIEANLDKIVTTINTRSPESLKEVQQLNECIVALSNFVSKCTEKCLPFIQLLKENKEYLGSEKCENTF